MRSMQDKFLNNINNNVKEYELEANVTYGASNTGKIYVMDKFKTVLIINFNFQLDYCSLNVCDPDEEALKHMSMNYLEYNDHTSITKFFQNLDSYAREYDMEKDGELEV